MPLFDFKTKEQLQARVGELEKEISLLKTKLEKETSDKVLLQKQVSRGQDFDVGKTLEFEKCRNKMQEYYSKMLFFERVIERYREIIDRSETLSVSNLRGKIMPSSEIVRQKLNSIDSNYSENQLRVLEQIKTYTDTITTVETNVNFWLSFEQISKYNIADSLGKAVFFASFVSALNFDYKILMCQLSSGGARPWVLVDVSEEKSILVDPSVEHSLFKYYSSKEDILSKYSFRDSIISKVLYEFDETDYVSHQGE